MGAEPSSSSVWAPASDLPEGWTRVTLAEVVDPVPNVRPESEPEREFGYVDISSISNETFEIVGCRRFKGRDAPSRARRPIRQGDVLFSNVRTYLRNVAIVPEELDAQLCSTGFTVLRSNGAIDPRFLFRCLLTDEFIDIVNELQTGTHYPATTDRAVLDQVIVLPPLAEQRRIVGQVESLLARTAAASERLSRTRSLMARFRQAVLVGACSGRLTEDWRSAELEGRIGEAGHLPSDWVWQRAGKLYADARYGTSLKCDRESSGGLPVLRIPNIASGRVDLSDMKYAHVPEHELRSLHLQPGDIVVCRTNGSLDLIGKAAVVPALLTPHAFASYLIRLRVKQDEVLPRYLHICLSGQVGRKHIEREARTTAGQFNLNLEILRSLPVPRPPLEEQHEIVRRVEALFALADAVERRVQAATARTERLTQAILARAFRGELVPTEAELARREGRDYEPAAALLARVRAERSRMPIKRDGRARLGARQLRLV